MSLSREKTILLFLTLLGAVVFAGTQYPPSFLSGDASLAGYAKNILETCSSETSAGARRICYEAEVPKLLGSISLKKAFAVTELIQEQDEEYLWCHNMAHQLSEQEYAKDPERWKNVVSECPVGTCSNGCIHGAIQAHFRAASLSGIQLEGLMPELASLCEERENWHPTGLEQASCYHELGHFSMYLVDADIERAANICQRVGVKEDGRNFVQTCNEGIFMQVFEPREPEDFALVYNLIPRKEMLPACEEFEGEAKGACWTRAWGGDARPLCEQFSGETKSACMREAWVAYDKEKIKTPEGVVDYCSYSPVPAEQKRCYNTLFYSLMSVFEFDVERMLQLCEGLPSQLMSQCFANTASRMVETDKDLLERAAAVCEYARGFGAEEPCYEELLYYADFSLHKGTDEFAEYCGFLPEPWTSQCLDKR